METIFAQSSAPGKAGVAVFRISGPKSLAVLQKLTDKKDFETRKMYYQKLVDPMNNELIDNAMVVYFKAPHSFTGEDIVEIHAHGSKAIAIMLTRALLNIHGLRFAEAGEFAKRAFLNDKFDLTAAEGLADLIEAETLQQHRQAVRQVGGALESLYNEWRNELLNVISLLEAYIDFPEEEVPASVLKQVTEINLNLQHKITNYLQDSRRGELLRSGIKLTILGPANVGKSSLLNFLMQRDIAIVSDIPGTTRDIIEGHLDIGGYPILLQDTAGIRTGTSDLIEQEGIKRAIESAKQADIKIIMFDAYTLNSELSNLTIKELIDANSIILVNKIDLIDTSLPLENYLKISVTNNIGLEEVLKRIEDIAHNIAGLTEVPYITRERHRNHLKQVLQLLAEFNTQKDLVLATEDIRLAIRAFSFITGKISVDEILGEIFSNFCIGK